MRWLVVFAIGCGGTADPTCPPGETCAPEFQRVVAGGGFACALDQFHRQWCWGGNEHRQIVDSDQTAFTRAVLGDRSWSSMSTRGGHTCAIDGGELWCWGKNDSHQVSAAIEGDVANPVRIEVDNETVIWTRVAAGVDYTCAIGDQRVYCWGSGTAGKLGNGTTDDVDRPRLIDNNFNDWIDVAAGLRHTCAVSQAHGTWCWGDGSFGQLGNGKLTIENSPQSVDLPDAVSIAVGLESTCAVNEGGALLCWGRAGAGALGDAVDPDGENRSTPAVASTLNNWREVAAGERHACARRADGSVYCWGTAHAGGIPDGRWTEEREFVRVIESGATSISLGWNGTAIDPAADEADLDLGCAVVDAGIVCWGDNRAGALGRGTTSRVTEPTAVAGGHLFTELGAGDAHACGLADAVYCWGSIENGQVAGSQAGRDPACTPEVCDLAEPQWVTEGDGLAVGANHACATDGSVVRCWGDSRLRQCGEVAPSAVTPRIVAGTWSGIFASANATCSVEVSGTPQLWCWGRGPTEHTPAVEPGFDAAAIDLAFGAGFGCQLDATGALACFGNPNAGRFGNGEDGICGDGSCNATETAATCAQDCGPGPLTHLGRSYARIAIGSSGFACALRSDGHVECWGDSSFGQAGTIDHQPVLEPFEVAALEGCTDVAAGNRHACAICDGVARCWGDARHGELGAPITSERQVEPRAIAAPDNERFTGVTAGDGFTCARTDTGHAYCWGTSVHGALGNGGRGANLPVAVELETGD